MPRRYDKCVKSVKTKIRTGKIPKTYVRRGVRRKTSPHAICSRLRAKGKKRDKFPFKTDEMLRTLLIRRESSRFDAKGKKKKYPIWDLKPAKNIELEKLLDYFKL